MNTLLEFLKICWERSWQQNVFIWILMWKEQKWATPHLTQIILSAYVLLASDFNYHTVLLQSESFYSPLLYNSSQWQDSCPKNVMLSDMCLWICFIAFRPQEPWVSTTTLLWQNKESVQETNISAYREYWRHCYLFTEELVFIGHWLE